MSHLPPGNVTERRFCRWLQAQEASPPLADLENWFDLSRFSNAVYRTECYLHQHPEVNFVDYWSENYPESLRNIHTPPWALYVLGRLNADTPILGVVGSRRPNAYGIEAVRQLLKALRVYPIQVVSGLALGIDSVAHAAANDAGIPNIAVLGSGFASLYPQNCAGLFEEILKREGCILTEHPPHAPAYPANFPRRNRIISGLSDVLFVVQGTEKSGTLHSVRYAVEQNKTVCTLPGDIFSDLSYVPHKLLREGAAPITTAKDLDDLLEQAKKSRFQN